MGLVAEASVSADLSSTRRIEEEDFEMGEEYDQLNSMSNSKFQTPMAKSGSLSAKPKERTMPCYEFFEKGRCEFGKDCTYSHDKSVLQAHGEKETATLMNSPYLSYRAKGILSGKTPVSKRDEVDQARLPPKPGSHLFDSSSSFKRPHSTGATVKMLANSNESHEPSNEEDDLRGWTEPTEPKDSGSTSDSA